MFLLILRKYERRRLRIIRSILIVEDVHEQRNYLIECAARYNSTIKIYSTDRSSEAINIVNNYDIDAFFIDIHLIDGNGFDLAKKIRSINKYNFVPIVFISGLRTKEMEAFHDIHCYDYILKPYTRKTIENIMMRIMVDYFEQENDDKKYLNLEYKGVKQQVLLKDIIIVESINRRIFIRTKNEQIKYKQININQFIEKLPDHFIQIHQSIIVNKDYIEKIDISGNCIKLREIAEGIPIGVSYRKKVGELIHGVL
jgi:DNA-binding LytR/AlgR family response regulator